MNDTIKNESLSTSLSSHTDQRSSHLLQIAVNGSHQIIITGEVIYQIDNVLIRVDINALATRELSF